MTIFSLKLLNNINLPYPYYPNWQINVYPDNSGIYFFCREKKRLFLLDLRNGMNWVNFELPEYLKVWGSYKFELIKPWIILC